MACGLCGEWTDDWSENHDKQGLIDMWLDGIAFAIRNDYPSNEFIKGHFEEELLEANGIFIDKRGLDLENREGMVVLCGDCTGRLSFAGYAVGQLHVRHGCNVRVEAGGLSKVFISVYGHAAVQVRQRDAAKVYVYIHGSDCRVGYEGEVSIRNSKE